MYLRRRKHIQHDSNAFAVYVESFITICTLKKACLLGKVVGDKVQLTDLGFMVNNTLDIINSNHGSTIIRKYVIMPNHIHLITSIPNDPEKNDLPFIHDIVRDFKSFTTKEYNRPHGELFVPLWQRGYYDHRIRNSAERIKIDEYIDYNPRRWHIDKFYVV